MFLVKDEIVFLFNFVFSCSHVFDNLCLSNSFPKLIKEVNDYIRSYNDWLVEGDSNKHKISKE